MSGNLITNPDFASGLTDWALADGAVATTGTFYGETAIQFTEPAFGGILSQEITITSADPINIHFLLAIAQDTSGEEARGGCNFSVFTNDTATTIGATMVPNTLVNDGIFWPLTNIQTYYAIDSIFTPTPADVLRGSIFIIFQNGQGLFEGPLFTMTEAYAGREPFCYNEGTQILCLKESGEEEYRAIENIRVGHLVKTYKHGAKAVTHIGKGEMINSHKNPRFCMHKLPKTGDLIDDLIVLGGHSILVDKFDSEEQEKQCLNNLGCPKIEDKFLLLAHLSPLFTKMPEGEKYTYYHLVLDNTDNDFVHYGIWANGILSETCSKVVFESHNLLSLM
jgi:hypothetical protein